jgi:hypothetical protein
MSQSTREVVSQFEFPLRPSAKVLCALGGEATFRAHTARVENVSEPGAVATGSGRTASSLLIRGGFLIRSLPLPVLTQA